MSRHSLRLITGLLIVAAIVLLAQPGRGQLRALPAKDASKSEEPKFTEAVTLPRNPESKRLIQAAQDYVKNQEWRIAGECLQSLLETPEDSFIEVTRKNDRGQDATIRVSVRSEANRIIGELPPDGLESYQVQYGQVAAEKLKQALETADPVMLAEVSQRYFNTKAGQEATNLLGTYQLDRGQYLMASLCFEKLLHRSSADQLPARVLFKAALAYKRIGNSAEADKLFTHFADQFGREQLQSKTRMSLDQFRGEFGREVGGDVFVNTTDWPMFHGNAARTAQCRGSTAYLEPRWSSSLIRPDEPPDVRDMPAVQWIEQHLDQAQQLLRDKPILPAFFPIAANGRLLIRSYDGVAAYTLKSDEGKKIKAGDLLWRSTADNSLFATIRDDIQGRRAKVQEWYTNYYLANNVGPVGVFFENSVLGTISHDGQRVYFVDDLAVPPHPSMLRGSAFMGAPVGYGPFTNEVQFNKLCAADIDSGKLSWTALGGKATSTAGPPNDASKDRRELNAAVELQDTFFLGPPLPLGGKLYLLTEKQSELRLICLDPNKQVPSGLNANDKAPDLVWVQTLGTANEKLPVDGYRRMQAAHLAYGDGILVCPTNAGAVVGVDLLSHSLVWAFSYRKAQQQNIPEDQLIFQRRRFGGLPSMGPTIGERWRTSAPCVVKGRVIFTAPDSGDVHCLSLRDGRPIWSAKREDADLYLAGAIDDRVVIVAKNQIRALSLDVGKEIWKRTDTGLPCGQGVAAEGVYYLPLANSADPRTADKGPEICAIDLKTGGIIGRSKSRKDTPGNLLFLDGELITQTIRTVSSFPLLKVKQDEINIALAKNPNDPSGLTERGELHLYNGAVRDAVADLRNALANQPPADVRTKARTKLHEALTTLFKDDFAGAEQYLAEYADLSDVEAPTNADADTKQRFAAERIRRQAAYLELLGRGRESQGRLLDAFNAYEQYSELSGHKELVDSLDEPNTKARPDIWSRGRIQALLTEANDADRKTLEAEITKRLSTVRAAASLDGLRKFVALYGPISASGKAARLELAERLLATGDADDLTEAERILATLCYGSRDRRDDPLAAGKATELMIRVCIRRGRYENAVGFARQLAEEFPEVPVREGMTGRQYFNEMSTDKRFLPYLDTPTAIWPGPLTGKRQSGNFGSRETSMTLQPKGDLLPFFERHRLVLEMNSWTLRMVDRATGEERWRVPNLPNGNYMNTGQVPSPFVHVRGQLLVLQMNEWVIAYDVSERKEVWRFNLLGREAHTAADQNQMRAFDPMINNVVMPSSDEKKTNIGRVAVVEASYVAVQGRDGLTAIDPAHTGLSRLWVKADVPTKANVFGDDRHVFIFDKDTPAGRPKCQALRAQDGVPVKCADFAEFYKKKIHTVGGCILVKDEGNRALRLIDAMTNQEVWRRDFATGSTIVKSDNDMLTGMIDPTGQFTLLDAIDGAVKFSCPLGADRAKNLQEATVLADRDMYYLALKRQPEGGLTWNCPAMPWVRHVSFNGPLIGLSRHSGQLEWVSQDLPHQTLLTEQWADLPLLLCASNYSKRASDGNPSEQGVVVTAVDKVNGKFIYDDKLTPSTFFHALVANPNAGKIEFIRQDVKITLAPESVISSEPPAKIVPMPAGRVIPVPPQVVPIARPVAPAPAPIPPGGQR
jgi:outer membrane protein assembly factor BamB